MRARVEKVDVLGWNKSYVCFTTQVRLFCLTNNYSSEKYHIILVGLFIKICNPLSCYPKYECNLWLFSKLTEAEFNETIYFFGTITWLGNSHMYMTNVCIPSVIKFNHNMGWYLVYWVSPVRGVRTILTTWYFVLK